MAEDFRAQITRDDIEKAIAALERGEVHAFGPSIFNDVLEGDRRYPPKAVVRLAARRALGRALRPDEFSGGEESWAFRLLRDRGFNVVKKLRSGDPSNEPEPFDPVSGTWQRRLAIEERLRRKLKLSTPSDQLRRAALEGCLRRHSRVAQGPIAIRFPPGRPLAARTRNRPRNQHP